jgi:hypothetical protein
MRLYSPRERVLFGILGLIFLATALIFGWIIIRDPSARSGDFLLAELGALGGVTICARIVLSGRATKWLEQPVGAQQDDRVDTRANHE